LALKGISVAASASAFMIVQSAFEGEAKARKEAVSEFNKSQEKIFSLNTLLGLIPLIGSFIDPSHTGFDPAPSYYEHRIDVAVQKLQSRLANEGIQLNQEEIKTFKEEFAKIWR